MIDFDHFAKSATRTESVIQSVPMSQQRLLTLLQLAVSAANILDLAKKEIFYGKAMDVDKLHAEIADLEGCIADVPEDMKKKPATCLKGNVQMTRVLHGAIGKFTESGEIIEAVIKAIKTGELDTVNLGEELGDDQWYNAIITDATGISMEEFMRRVIVKLKTRYPEKFSQKAALNRDLAAERQVLEGKTPNATTVAAMTEARTMAAEGSGVSA